MKSYPQYYFCTYFDSHYLPRALALYHSLREHCPAFHLWMLCMDRVSYEVLNQLGLPNIKLIALEDFERGDEELLKAKHNRTLIEYYFTCTSSLLLFILNNYPDVDVITYLDADLFFFADPAPVYDEVADHSVAIIEHRFPPDLRYLEQTGIYNVGWLSFRHDEEALACLSWWRTRCLEWCYERCEDGRFADQKYLDTWPSLFQGVVVVRHKGANLAPWNLANYDIHIHGNQVYVDEQPLVFFHFHGLKQIKDWLYDLNLQRYKVRSSRIVRRQIYGPYIQILRHVNRDGALRGSIRGPVGRSRLRQLLRTLLDVYRGIFSQDYIFVLDGHVLP